MAELPPPDLTLAAYTALGAGIVIGLVSALGIHGLLQPIRVVDVKKGITPFLWEESLHNPQHRGDFPWTKKITEIITATETVTTATPTITVVIDPTPTLSPKTSYPHSSSSSASTSRNSLNQIFPELLLQILLVMSTFFGSIIGSYFAHVRMFDRLLPAFTAGERRRAKPPSSPSPTRQRTRNHLLSMSPITTVLSTVEASIRDVAEEVFTRFPSPRPQPTSLVNRSARRRSRSMSRRHLARDATKLDETKAVTMDRTSQSSITRFFKIRETSPQRALEHRPSGAEQSPTGGSQFVEALLKRVTTQALQLRNSPANTEFENALQSPTRGRIQTPKEIFVTPQPLRKFPALSPSKPAKNVHTQTPAKDLIVFSPETVKTHPEPEMTVVASQANQTVRANERAPESTATSIKTISTPVEAGTAVLGENNITSSESSKSELLTIQPTAGAKAIPTVHDQLFKPVTPDIKAISKQHSSDSVDRPQSTATDKESGLGDTADDRAPDPVATKIMAEVTAAIGRNPGSDMKPVRAMAEPQPLSGSLRWDEIEADAELELGPIRWLGDSKEAAAQEAPAKTQELEKGKPAKRAASPCAASPEDLETMTGLNLKAKSTGKKLEDSIWAKKAPEVDDAHATQRSGGGGMEASKWATPGPSTSAPPAQHGRTSLEGPRPSTPHPLTPNLAAPAEPSSPTKSEDSVLSETEVSLAIKAMSTGRGIEDSRWAKVAPDADASRAAQRGGARGIAASRWATTPQQRMSTSSSAHRARGGSAAAPGSASTSNWQAPHSSTPVPESRNSQQGGMQASRWADASPLAHMPGSGRGGGDGRGAHGENRGGSVGGRRGGRRGRGGRW